MTRGLTCVSEALLAQLRRNIRNHLDRYCGSGFAELADDPGWSIEVPTVVDLKCLADLDGSRAGAGGDLENTRTVASALHGLTPSLANEERIWVRLSHVEAFSYARDRWLDPDLTEDELIRNITTHFFAPTQTRIRDDHAVSRLWWNHWIAAHCYPENPERALELMLTRADVRSNLVERVWLTGRRKLGGAVFRAMERGPFVLMSERSFREFMKSLNVLGAGVVFEAMTDGEIDDFMIRCSEHAMAAMERPDER